MRLGRARWLRLAVAALCGLLSSAGRADAPLTLVLNWVPGADHAPFFYALREGWYARAGIVLSIESVAGSPEAIKRAAQTPATLAVADFVSYLRARSSLPGTTAVLALQPLSPYAVYFSATSGIAGAQDLAGKRIAVQPQDPMRRLWPVLAQRNGIATGNVTWVDRSNAQKPDALLAGEADAAFNPFLHNHLNYAAVLGADMRVLWWHELGFASYGQVLVASAEAVERTPELVRAFVTVTQRAWAQCLAQAAPCIDALLAEHPQLDRQREQAVWELLTRLYRTSGDAPGPLGNFDPARVALTARDLDVAFDTQTPTAGLINTTFLDPVIRAPH